MDLPADLKYDLEAALTGSRDGSIRNINGKLLHEEQVDMLGYPGREFVASTRQGGLKKTDYLYHSLRDRKKELFKVLYLNSQNKILAAEDRFEGTVNSSAVFPREVIESALDHKAVSLIFVHNHPSGNPEPSQSDKDLTRDLIFAANAVNIKVLDHIIIGNDRYFSFSGSGLIDQGELNFRNLKMKGTSAIKPKNSSGGLPDSGLRQ